MSHGKITITVLQLLFERWETVKGILFAARQSNVERVRRFALINDVLIKTAFC